MHEQNISLRHWDQIRRTRIVLINSYIYSLFSNTRMLKAIVHNHMFAIVVVIATILLFGGLDLLYKPFMPLLVMERRGERLFHQRRGRQCRKEIRWFFGCLEFYVVDSHSSKSRKDTSVITDAQSIIIIPAQYYVFSNK